MPNILQVAVPNGGAAIAWNGRSATPAINSLLLMNADLNNTIYVGNDPSITANTGARIPIQPNGSLSVDPTSSWYVVGAASGIAPMVMVPNGQAYFLGITAGLGNLVIPSVQSPNFVNNISGWQIGKNGNAQFNNLTIRGTFFGLDFIINSSGAFFYNGTPALGNLKISIASAAGVDQFGNVYTDNIASYNVAVAGGGYAQLAANDTSGIPFLVLNPVGATVLSGFPQGNASTVNSGAANELYQLNLDSGFTTGTGSVGNAILQLLSRSNDSTVASIARLLADTVQITLQDGVTYNAAKLTLSAAGGQLINQTSAAVVTGCGPSNVIARNYRFHARIQFAGSQAAGTANFQIGTTATSSKLAMTGEMHDTAVGTSNYTSRGALGPNTSPTLTTNAWWMDMEAEAFFTGSGAISLQAFCSVAADTFTVTGGFLEITPLY